MIDSRQHLIDILLHKIWLKNLNTILGNKQSTIHERKILIQIGFKNDKRKRE